MVHRCEKTTYTRESVINIFEKFLQILCRAKAAPTKSDADYHLGRHAKWTGLLKIFS